MYQFNEQAKQLCRLCVTWRQNIRAFPGGEPDDSWGPSNKDLQDALVIEFNPSWLEECRDDETDRQSNESSEDGEWEDITQAFDDELVESMEAIAFTDEYRMGESDPFFYSDRDTEYTLTTPSGSPLKQNRDV
jgi:hypothetical protein